MPLPIFDPLNYEPREYGADCDRCILREMREGRPVPPEVHPEATVFVIAEAPGATEVSLGRPLIGKSGELETTTLNQIGYRRQDVTWSNACVCRPPGNNFDLVLSSLRGRNAAIRRKNDKIRKENRERRARGEETLPLTPELPTPVECCRPRLMYELADYKQIIALGKISVQALVPGHTAGILKMRGGPMGFHWGTDSQGRRQLVQDPPTAPTDDPLQRDLVISATPAAQVDSPVKVIPTVHPAFVLRSGRWKASFEEDHRRAVRLFQGQLTWSNPEMIFNPSLLRLAEVLGLVWCPTPPPDAVRYPLGQDQPWKIGVPNGWSGGWWADPAKARPLGYDWETDALEAIDCVIRCIQIGTRESVLTPFFHSVEKGNPGYYTAVELEVVWHMVRAWLTGPGWKLTWNGGYYDQLVDTSALGVLARWVFDGMMGHRLILGEMPHGLRQAGSDFEDVHDWKAGDPGVNARSDRVLGVYGSLDTAVTFSVGLKILQRIAAVGLGRLVEPEMASRLLPEPKPRRPAGTGQNWWWVNYTPPIPHGLPVPMLVVKDPGAPNQLDPKNQPDLVAFTPGITTPMTSVQARALTEAGAPVIREGMQGLLALDHAMQAGCCDMHIIGMHPNQEMRLQFLQEQSKRFNTKLTSIRKRVESETGRSNWALSGKEQPFNPASTYHLSRLLYEDWELPVTAVSEKTQKPSTGDSALRKLLALKSLPDAARAFILDLREFRKAHKILGTYLKPMAMRHPNDRTKSRPPQPWGRRWAESWGQEETVFDDDKAQKQFEEIDWDDPEQFEELAEVTGAEEAETWEQFRERNLYAPEGKSKLRDNNRVHPDWKAHTCFDGATEVLTLRGWVCFRDLAADDMVAQWRQDLGGGARGTIEFVKPLEFIRKPYRGEMIHLTNPRNHVDLFVTPDHRCALVSRTGKLTFPPAASYPTRCRQVLGGMFSGGDVTLPAHLVGLLCAAQADGTWYPGKGNNYWRFGLKKERKKARIREILSACAGTWNEFEVSREGYTHFTLYGEDAAWAAQMLRAGQGETESRSLYKVWGPWLLQLDHATRQQLLDEIYNWDALHEARNYYCSTIKENAEWIQTLHALNGEWALLLVEPERFDAVFPDGHTGHRVPCYKVSRSPRPYVWTDTVESQRVPWNDDVYCLTVPSSCLVVRRNDRIHVSGNCVTGRLSSTPNLQNWLRWLRSMVIPADLAWLEFEANRMRRNPNECRVWAAYGVDLHKWKPTEGHLFVYADSDQLELRIAAARWKAMRYLEAFATSSILDGKREWMDPHQITMHAVWGDKIWGMAGAPDLKSERFFKKYGKNSEFDRMRDLGKRILYASMSADTSVTITSNPGGVRIDQLQPNTITWAWSRRYQQLLPTKITRVWKSGTDRKLMCVTFKDHKGHRYQEKLTPNHLMLLRTGEFRAVSALAPGDRLMPFKRFVASSGYRMLDTNNEGVWETEHRHYGRCVTGQRLDEWHIHHKDRDKLNNHADNLECLSIADHAREHHDEKLGTYNAWQWAPSQYEATCARLAEARKNSALWWERTFSPEVIEKRAQAMQEHWNDPVRSAAHREALSGIQESCLDVLAHEIGTVPDQVIADKVGCTSANVVHWRKIRGVPSWEETYRAEHGLKRDAIKVHPLLGQIPDSVVAQDLGCDRALVRKVRMDMGIADPPKRKAGGKKGVLQGSALDAYRGFFGVLTQKEIGGLAGKTPGTVSSYVKSRKLLSRPDPARVEVFELEVGHIADDRLAEQLDVSIEALQQYRQAHGIPAYWEMDAPEGEELNHVVVSVEELPGLHDVWDLEVEHEDHCFALESGIIVHNSQYGARAPTVHDVITSAEDKKGNLLYKDLTLGQVRLMQRNLLKNMPEFKRGWDWEIGTLKAQGYLQEPVTGRRFECLDGYDDLSLVVNRPIQASGAALIAMATAEMLQKYPAGFGGPYTGLANHCHDAMTWEVPASMADMVASDLTDAMTRTIAAYPDVAFVGDAEVCKKWQ